MQAMFANAHIDHFPLLILHIATNVSLRGSLLQPPVKIYSEQNMSPFGKDLNPFHMDSTNPGRMRIANPD